MIPLRLFNLHTFYYSKYTMYMLDIFFYILNTVSTSPLSSCMAIDW